MPSYFCFYLHRWRRRLSSTNSFVSGWASWWLVPRAQVKAPSGSCCSWPLVKWARQWNTTQWTQRPCQELRLVFRDVVNFLWNGVNLFQAPNVLCNNSCFFLRCTDHVSTSVRVAHNFAAIEVLSSSTSFIIYNVTCKGVMRLPTFRPLHLDHFSY